MAVIRPDWVLANPLNPGPETYAPPDRRTPEQPYEADRVALLRSQTEAGQSSDQSAGSLDALIRRAAGAAMDEIDDVIRELEGVRDLLRNEGERVSREVAGYASLSRASMTAMKTIADSIKKWKGEDKSR